MAYNENPSYLKLSGGTMTGILTLNGDPSGANDAANKNYVDAISAGLTFKTSCICATTVNLNATYLNGTLGVGATLVNAGALAAFTVDGITPTINQRVLVKNQTTQFQNGIYTITTLGTGVVAWVLTRATDYDQAAEIKPGDIIPVSTGSTQSNTNWLQTGSVATMGTDLITFQQYQSTPISTTQYDVLVGGPSNTVVSVGPGSTGQVLQSAGNASNPAYSSATYPLTATTGDIIYASASNVFGNLADVATGQVLVSGGAGAIPAYSATPTVTSITFGSGNALNTYVTATWTPNLQINASSTGITYGTQLGGYTQIGNVVYLWMRVVLSSKGVSSGNVSISNFPVNGGTNGTNQTLPINNFTQFTAASYTSLAIKGPTSGTSAGNFTISGSGQATAILQDTQITNTFAFSMSGFYILD